MSRVFVLNHDRSPLSPCRPARARILLDSGKAAVLRRYPFTIILKEHKVNPVVKEHRIKIDPGSKTTGFSLVQRTDLKEIKVVLGLNLEHRGNGVSLKLRKRSGCRRNRRLRNTRYRKSRFLNRTGKWRMKFGPSLESRMSNVLTWINRIRRYCKVTELSYELNKFDTHKMVNPEISGIEYCQGELQGYEVIEYLKEKFDYTCAYCGCKNVKFQKDHIHPKSKGGTDRISNLVLSCVCCNKEKGNKDIDEFLVDSPELLMKIKKLCNASLKDASIINCVRKELLKRIQLLGIPVETGSGALTKYNRSRLNIWKDHWVDASCVGNVERIDFSEVKAPLLVKACGHGKRQMCRTNKMGFPVCHKSKHRIHFGFKTGDICKGINKGPKNKGKIGLGRIVITGGRAVISGIKFSFVNLTMLQMADGYVTINA